MPVTHRSDRQFQIVVVEDTLDDAEMTMRALSQCIPAPTSTLARDGSEALELLTGEEACRPDLIFLDLKLPKVSGLELLRILKESPDTRATPAVVLTSSDEPGDIAKATALGADEYILKPMNWEEYAEVICQVVSKYLPSSVGEL